MKQKDYLKTVGEYDVKNKVDIVSVICKALLIISACLVIIMLLLLAVFHYYMILKGF